MDYWAESELDEAKVLLVLVWGLGWVVCLFGFLRGVCEIDFEMGFWGMCEVEVGDWGEGLVANYGFG